MTKYEMILSVYHTHSISVTAEKYNYTQSAISQAIKSFEKELGLPLFKRTKNGMLPISNTEEIIRELRTICDAENRIADIASNLTSLKNGYIHIGTIKSIAYNWLPSMVKNFSKKYPNIHFKISMGSSSQLHDKLDQNEVDCIFVSNYLLPDNLEFYPMDTDEPMLLTWLSRKRYPMGWESVYYRNYCCPIRHSTSASAHLRSITNGHWAWHI